MEPRWANLGGFSIDQSLKDRISRFGPRWTVIADAARSSARVGALRIAADVTWVGDVVVGRVVWWVVWIADCLVQLATRAPKP